ncbi:MAG: DUF368 domain-containing protein [Clostridium sp.]
MKVFKNIIKGLAISLSTLIPGVSGGTMAIILGVYDDLIHAIGSFFQDVKKHSRLILELGIGGVVGLVLFSGLVEKSLQTFPFQMGFFFMGVVIGGLPTLYKRATKGGKKKSSIYYFLVGLIIAVVMTLKPGAIATAATGEGVGSFIFLFVGGIIIAVALILPGISASFMLLTLGMYEITLQAINSFNIAFLIPLGLGAVIGTLATTKALEKLMEKYPQNTYMLILGFVLGSLIPIYPGVPSGIFNIIFCIISFVLGAILIYTLGKRSNE